MPEEDAEGARARRRRAVPPDLVCLVLLFLARPAGTADAATDTADSDTDTVTRAITVNLGQRVLLPCGQNKSSDISWQFAGDEHLRLNTSGSLIIADSGDLLIPAARLSDAGLYSCHAETKVVVRIGLEVRDVPSRVTNMSVHTNSVFAVVSWDPPGPEHGLAVEGFHCQHRRDMSHFQGQPRPRDLQYTKQQLPSSASQCAVYHLLPNTTYYFRVAATNRLGTGDWVSLAGTTKPLVRSHGNLPQAAAEDAGYGRLLAVCLSVSLLGLLTLGSGIGLLLVRRGSTLPSRPVQESAGEEALELVPHITLNPSFNIDMLEHIGEEESSEHAFLVDHGGAGG